MFRIKVVEKRKTHILYSITFFSEYHAVYEITWKNIVERGRPQLAILHMRIACWITKATSTHSGYVILIAFPKQQWLHERASLLSYTNIVFLIFLRQGWRYSWISRLFFPKGRGTAGSAIVNRRKESLLNVNSYVSIVKKRGIVSENLTYTISMLST